MIYNKFHELSISALGLGCMRFPLNSKEDDDIDVERTAQIVDYAIKNGINYFDTAWRYHAGMSEPIMGKLLSQYPRDSYYIASKFPGFSQENFDNKESIFQDQLDRCQVDHFDFYLCHCVFEKNIDNYVSDEFREFILSQKRNGHIKHFGFSTHGSLQTMKRFLDAYAGEVEFCQIQLNYLDWKLQNAKAKVELIRSYGLPVWVMEPVRGGRLASLPEETMEKLKTFRPDWSAAQWAFRFLQSVEGIGMILSGMSNLEQLTENIRVFSDPDPISQEEKDLLMSIADEMISRNDVPCTGCSYCVEHCPQGIVIPEIMKKYNQKDWSETPDCIGCQSCERVCPQGISISQIMKKYNEQ